MATSASYLEEAAGGMVSAAAFDDDDAAAAAVRLLRDSGVREQDISVIAKDRRRAERIAADHAWVPGKGWGGLVDRLMRLLNGGVPSEVRERYGRALSSGQIVVVAAAGDQPPDTIAALLRQSRGDLIDEWWQAPTQLFAPPELAGPF
jgi:heat induced stress protein YflT